jgi:hypothetical protein
MKKLLLSVLGYLMLSAIVLSCGEGLSPPPEMEKAFLLNKSRSIIYYTWYDYHPGSTVAPAYGSVESGVEEMIGDEYLGVNGNGWFISDVSLALYADEQRTILVADKTLPGYRGDGEAEELPKEGEKFVTRVIVTQEMVDDAAGD